MRLERRRDGERFVVEAYGPDRHALDEQRSRLPGSYVQWESLGIPLLGPDGRTRLSGPTFVLWRRLEAAAPAPRLPAAPPDLAELDELEPPEEPERLAAPEAAPAAPPDLEDPADFLADFLAERSRAPDGPAPPQPLAPQEQLVAAPAPAPEVAQDAPPEPGALVAVAEPAPARRRGRPPHQAKSVKYKNITRVDRPARKMYGFHVRLGWKGRVYQKWFSDSTHGDRLGALTAALAWRDAKERELGKPRTEGMLKGKDRTSNTGIVGVASVTLGGRPYYRALWRDAEGRQHRRWFSVERLGEKRAPRAAIKAREAGEAARLR